MIIQSTVVFYVAGCCTTIELLLCHSLVHQNFTGHLSAVLKNKRSFCVK